MPAASTRSTGGRGRSTPTLEYLVYTFCSLDAQMSAEGVVAEQPPVPEEGRGFYLVLVGALLHALETESRSRAAFVDQLRSCWPSAAEAN